MIRSGSAPRAVHSNAWVLNSWRGSRIRTQRTGTAGKPVLYQRAVLETTSRVRSSAPYQSATTTDLHLVLGSSATTERFGNRPPLSRGLPISALAYGAERARRVRRPGADG